MQRIITGGLLLALGYSGSLVAGGANAAWAWGSKGHEIVAYIAAHNLSPAAQTHIAHILGTSDGKRAVSTALAQAAVRPDAEFRTSAPETKPWHFIDICLQDTKSDLMARCPEDQGCIVSKLDAYVSQLRTGQFDAFGADGALAFVVHFVGDIHQPLHASTNSDRGGNCRQVLTHPSSKELHDTWDRVVVVQLEKALHTHTPAATASALERLYKSEKATFTWPTNATATIAWESTKIARSSIYTALRIPEAECVPDLNACPSTPFPTVTMSAAKLARARDLAGRQLAKAGYRLANLLNTIWP